MCDTALVTGISGIVRANETPSLIITSPGPDPWPRTESDGARAPGKDLTEEETVSPSDISELIMMTYCFLGAISHRTHAAQGYNPALAYITWTRIKED